MTGKNGVDRRKGPLWAVEHTTPSERTEPFFTLHISGAPQ